MLDEAIEYLKQLQLKVQVYIYFIVFHIYLSQLRFLYFLIILQTLTMRNGYGLPPIYSQEQEMQRGRGIGFNEVGASFSQNHDFSVPREFDIGMPSLTNIMKPDMGFGQELTNENHYGFANMKVNSNLKFHVICL